MVDEATPAAAPADAVPEKAAAAVLQAAPAAPASLVPELPEGVDPYTGVAVAEAPAEERLSLRDWCTRHSKIAREVELLGAFFHEERARARHFDTATAYRERFEALRVRPA